MIKPKLPRTDAEWEALAEALVKANLKMAGMSYTDLQAGLAGMGVMQSTNNISAKINRGRFSAVFLLQSLVAAGCEAIVLPTLDPTSRDLKDDS